MTILFAKDWSLYPSAIVDTQTTNKSFIRMAAILKKRGIKNHAFMLSLINPSLQGVDPYDPNLTLEQMVAIAVECQNNLWYFVREVARAPGMAGDDSVPFECNRGNLALFWSFMNHIMIFLIQIRQTGKSFSTDTLMTWLMTIVCTDTEINLLTKDDTLRAANIKRVKDIMAEMPGYLQLRAKGDSNNSETITINRLNNIYKAHVPQMSPKGAYKLGRGLSSPIFQVDEAPYQPNIQIAMGSALAAGTTAVDRAKKAGKPYGTIITTTAGKKDDKDGAFIYGLLQDAFTWDEGLFDCENHEELVRVVTKGSRGRVFRVNATFDHLQLGKTDEWLLEKLQASTQSGEDADRDFFNRWTSGNASHPLPIEELELISKSVVDPQFMDIDKDHSYITRWYVPEHQRDVYMASNHFVLSLDPSDGAGGDDISFHMTNINDLETTASGLYNELNLIEFAKWLCLFLVRYKNVTCIIEARSSGRSLLDYLCLMLPEHGEDPFVRLYNRVVQESDEQPERYREICVPMSRRPRELYIRHKRAFGFATSGAGYASRHELYSTTLRRASKRSCGKIRDKTLANQILGLVERNGRIDHAVGGHDDAVIAWLLTHWLLTQGKNLAHYGIDSKQIDINTQRQERRALDPDTLHRIREQEIVRKQLDALVTKMVSNRDSFIQMKMENEIKLLSRKVILEEGETFSVDELLKGLKQLRREKNYANRATA